MRLFVALIFFFLFEWVAFRYFSFGISNWGEMGQLILNNIFWSNTFLALFAGLGLFIKPIQDWISDRFTFIRTYIISGYIGKFLLLVFFCLDGVRLFFVQIINSLFGTDWLTTQSLSIAQIGVFAFIGLLSLLIYGMLRNRHRYQLHETDVSISSLPHSLDGLKIIQISDIHSGSFTEKEPLKKAIDLINQQEADLVFFTGDLVNSIAQEIEPFIDVFQQIKSKYGVFSILGNHDYGDYVAWKSLEAKQRNFQQLLSAHERLGWQLLRNEHRVLEIEGEELGIIGVENFSASHRFSKYGNLERAYSGIKEGITKLLLSHDPSHWDFEVTKAFKDIAITFSGHTHGMQFGIEIPGWFKWSPVKYAYKQWAGLYQEGKQYLYVNRGFGYLGYPGRVGILPEISVLTLRKGEKNL